MEKTESLYINIYDYEDTRFPFQVFIGGRGTGKTYSALNGAEENKNQFIYMRRTLDEVEMMSDNKINKGINPFKVLNKNKDNDFNIFKTDKKVFTIFENWQEEKEVEKKVKNKETKEIETVKEKIVVDMKKPHGYALPLSTIASVRSMDFSDVDLIIFDEFIPELHVKKITHEGDAILNAYETINRNRELDGLPPCRFYLLANSNDIYNDLFITLGVVDDVEKMLQKGIADKYYYDRGLAIHLLSDTSEFIKKKKETALYKLAKDTSFSDMALSNKFAYNDFSDITYKRLTGYRPICSFDNEIFLYEKKGSGEVHCSYAKANCIDFRLNEQGIRNFNQNFGTRVYQIFVNGNITFESYAIKQTILDILI